MHGPKACIATGITNFDEMNAKNVHFVDTFFDAAVNVI